MNPVPGEEFEGWLGESDDFNALQCQRFTHSIVAQQIACSKQLALKQNPKSNVVILCDCLITHIKSDEP